ncbi:hypothetical protein HDU80_003030 [Chytriomyces hyalinus]|nr:hypothetical protein HDU80_003030 [Chytriomyces hyalinus]
MGGPILGTIEAKAGRNLAARIGREAKAEGSSVAAEGLTFFADAEWVVERGQLFKTYAVKSSADTTHEQQPISLTLITLPSDPSNALLRHIFNCFEACSLSPHHFSASNVFVMTMDIGTHLGSATAVKLDPSIHPSLQIDTIAGNVSLLRLGCVSDPRSAYSSVPLPVSDKFYSSMGLRDPRRAADVEPLSQSVKRLVTLVQRNLYLLGFYPLPGPQQTWHALLPQPSESAAGNSSFDEFWFDGIVCNTTILGMTEFVSEFGPFDHTSLHQLEERSIILPTLITALFKTVFIMRQNLMSLGFGATPAFIEHTLSSVGGGVAVSGIYVSSSGGPSFPAPPMGSTSLGEPTGSSRSKNAADWKEFERFIKKFQRAHDIPVSGVLGSASRRKLMALVKELKLKQLQNRASYGRVGVGADEAPGRDFFENEGRDGARGGGGRDTDPMGAMQRGMDMLRTLGTGVGGEDGSGAARKKKQAFNVEDVTIDFVVQMARNAEESNKIAAAKLEKQQKRADKRSGTHTGTSAIRAMSPVRRKSTNGKKMLRSSVGNNMSDATSPQSATPSVNSAENLNTRIGQASSSLAAKKSGLALSPFKETPPSPNHLFPKYSSIKISHGASIRSLSPGTSPAAVLSENDGAESDTNPITDEASMQQKPQQKILRGIKNIGINVKRLAALSGNTVTTAVNTVASGRRNSVEALADEHDDFRYVESPEPSHVVPPVIIFPVTVNDQGLIQRHRSLSLGATADYQLPHMANTSNTSELEVSNLAAPTILRRSMSDGSLSLSVPIQTPRMSTEQATVHSGLDNYDIDESSPDIKTLKPLKTKRVVTARRSKSSFKVSKQVRKSSLVNPASASPTGTHATDMSKPDENIMPAANISVQVTAADVEGGATEMESMIQKVSTQLSQLHHHPKIGTVLKADVDHSQNGILPILQTIESTSAHISHLIGAQSASAIAAADSQLSISQLRNSLSEMQSALAQGCVTRSEQKTRLVADLKSLIAVQEKAALSIDALSVQSLKLKYAVGLLEGRVSEMEEAANAFATRVDKVEAKYKEGSSARGGWIGGWWK